MEESDINSTKNKLFQKAFEVASHNGGVPVPVFPMHQHQQFNNSGNSLGPPLSIDINTTDGALEGAGFKYRFPQNQSGGQFNIGGSYEPGYSTSAPGFYPGETIENEVPMNYRINAGYGGKNWGINWSHGNNRGHGVNLNTNMQF